MNNSPPTGTTSGVNVVCSRYPLALTPGFTGATQPSGMKPLYDDVLKSWVAPFMMATINTKNIHRSNMLQNHCYGEAIAKAVAEDTSMATDQTRPGEAPTQEQRETGYINKQGLGANTGCQGRPHL